MTKIRSQEIGKKISRSPDFLMYLVTLNRVLKSHFTQILSGCLQVTVQYIVRSAFYPLP